MLGAHYGHATSEGSFMFLELNGLLTQQEVARLVALSGELKFVEGRLTNPAHTAKDNMQTDTNDPKFAASVQIVASAFTRSREFPEFAVPKRIAPPLLSRYEPGMKYGAHADAPHIQISGITLQSDLSATVFLSAPGSCEGGELVVHVGTHPVLLKGPPGAVVVYPSTMLH